MRAVAGRCAVFFLGARLSGGALLVRVVAVVVRVVPALVRGVAVLVAVLVRVVALVVRGVALSGGASAGSGVTKYA